MAKPHKATLGYSASCAKAKGLSDHPLETFGPIFMSDRQILIEHEGFLETVLQRVKLLPTGGLPGGRKQTIRRMHLQKLRHSGVYPMLYTNKTHNKRLPGDMRGG